MQALPAVHSDARRAFDRTVTRHMRRAGRFAVQFVEMCAAMCAGGIVLDLAFFQGAALLGFPNFFQQNRELSILILGLNWAIAMGVWMAVRGHPWRHNLEMSSTAVVAALSLVVAYWWFGFTPRTNAPGWFGQFLFQCGPSCALMGAYMLLRLNHYAAGSMHHTNASVAS
jgi:hypothetical protein